MTPSEHEESTFIMNEIIARTEEMLDSLKRNVPVQFMVMVGQRTVSKGLEPLKSEKTKRLIMALEKPEAVLWKTFTPHLQNVMRDLKCESGLRTHVAWCDAPQIDIDMQKHLDWSISQGFNTVSGDVSNFDASVIPDIWLEMAKGMASWFKNPKFFYALNKSIVDNIKVLSPIGVTIAPKSSIKSGSGGTNFIDSQYNKLALYYGQEAGFFKAQSLSVQGDDFIVSGAGVEPESITEAYTHLGLEVHPDKQNYAKDRLNYLQRLHLHGNLGGIASTYRVLGSALVYEKLTYNSRDWNPAMEAIQILSKLENAAFHPAFEALVQMVQKWDKYHLLKDMTPQQVIRKAGKFGADLIARDTAASISTRTAGATTDDFVVSPANGVLRGEVLPPFGSKARFHRVYGDARISNS